MRQDRLQLNVRVPARKKRAVDKLCDALSFTRDELVEIALDGLFGSSDGLSQAKRMKASATAKRMSLSSSFNAGQAMLPGFCE